MVVFTTDGSTVVRSFLWRLWLFPTFFFFFFFFFFYKDLQGPVVKNLTNLLANVILKFLSLNVANVLIYFAEKKCE